MTELRPYQREAVRFGLEAWDFLLADQQGLGKTVETIRTVVEASSSGLHLILTPKVAVSAVWGPEIARWAPEAEVITVTGSRTQREEALRIGCCRTNITPHVFVVANIEMARLRPDEAGKFKVPEYDLLHSTAWDTVVVDESHRALIRTSGKGTQLRAGMKSIGRNASRRIAVSGTPMRGKPEQLWGTLNWLRPKEFSAYWRWVGRYFAVTADGFSDYVISGRLEGSGDKMAKDLAPLMLRRTKAEVLTELPPKSYAGTHLIAGDEESPFGIWLDLLPGQRAQYDQFCEDGSLDFPDGTSLIANGTLAEYTRKRQLAGAIHAMDEHGRLTPTVKSAKLAWLLEKLDELDEDAKIVVASQFSSLLRVFRAALEAKGYPAHLITGATPDRERANQIHTFQTNTHPSDPRVFLINTKAGGVAITLDAADDLVLLDETTIPDDQEQVEDRIHRASRMHNVTIHYLRMRDTIDEEVAYIAAAREDVQKYIMDGARGIQYARNLYETSRAARSAETQPTTKETAVPEDLIPPLADKLTRELTIVETEYALWLKEQTGATKLSARTVALATSLQSQWRKTPRYAAAVEARDAVKINAEKAAAAAKQQKAAEKVLELEAELAKARAAAGIEVVAAVVEVPVLSIVPPAEEDDEPVPYLPTPAAVEVTISEVIEDDGYPYDDEFGDDTAPTVAPVDDEEVKGIVVDEEDDSFMVVGAQTDADDDDDDFEAPAGAIKVVPAATIPPVVTGASVDDDQDDDDY